MCSLYIGQSSPRNKIININSMGERIRSLFSVDTNRLGVHILCFIIACNESFLPLAFGSDDRLLTVSLINGFVFQSLKSQQNDRPQRPHSTHLDPVQAAIRLVYQSEDGPLSLHYSTYVFAKRCMQLEK